MRLGPLAGGAGSEFAVACAGVGNTPAQIDLFSVGASGVALSQAITVAAGLAGGFAVDPSLSIAAGDFNGDGNVDLAVGQSGSSGGGKVYVLWSIGSQGAAATLGDGNLALSGAAPTSQFGTLSPALDLNNDGFTELIVGDAFADHDSASGTSDGQLYDLRLSSTQDMARAQAAIAANSHALLTNTSIGGTPYLQAGSSGVYTVGGTFAAGQAEAWYTFTTLGDGAGPTPQVPLGNQIAVSPTGQACIR